MAIFLQSLISGVLIGGVYALIGIGLTIIFGVMRVINFAHGDILMIGMYLTYELFTLFHIDPFVSILITIPVMFLFGGLLQKIFINRIQGALPQNQILLTIGLGLIMSNTMMLVYTSNYKIITTSYSSDSFKILQSVINPDKFESLYNKGNALYFKAVSAGGDKAALLESAEKDYAEALTVKSDHIGENGMACRRSMLIGRAGRQADIQIQGINDDIPDRPNNISHPAADDLYFPSAVKPDLGHVGSGDIPVPGRHHLVRRRQVGPELKAQHAPLAVAFWHLLVNNAAPRRHPLHIPFRDTPRVAQAVAMFDIALQDIGDGLYPPVRMPGKPFQVVLRSAGSEIVKEKKGIEQRRLGKTEDPFQPYARPLHGRKAHQYLLNFSYRIHIFLLSFTVKINNDETRDEGFRAIMADHKKATPSYFFGTLPDSIIASARLSTQTGKCFVSELRRAGSHRVTL